MKKGIIFLMVLAMALCSATAAFSWGKQEAENETLAVNLYKEATRGDYGIVSTTELNSWIQEKKPMLIIDTMPYEDSYKKSHIPGAVCFEFPIPEMETMDDATKAKFLELLGPDKDRLLVFYCGFTKCTRSHNGAMWAKKLGYTNVYRCPGGIKGWKENGFADEK